MTATAASTALPAASRVPPSRAVLVERANRLYHDAVAERFDRDHAWRHRAEAGFWRFVGREVLGHRPSRPRPRRVLDIACGSGFVLEQLTPFLDRNDLAIGIDLSAAPLSIARRKLSALSGRHALMSGNAAQIPLQRWTIDLAAINASLHHFADVAAVLDEIDRVLVPGGWVAIGFEPNARYFEMKTLRAIGGALDRLRWYASPRQNRRRLHQAARCFWPQVAASGAHDRIAEQIAARLHGEGLCAETLPAGAILDLIDAHARSDGAGHQGLRFAEIRSALPGYELLHFQASDYLGASVRCCRTLRCLLDALGRRLGPECGLLFSCLLRKPEVRR
jgi:ubiquinone/menaquinone biosynthesis C-methylase UbiE